MALGIKEIKFMLWPERPLPFRTDSYLPPPQSENSDLRIRRLHRLGAYLKWFQDKVRIAEHLPSWASADLDQGFAATGTCFAIEEGGWTGW